jgi:hypothetical protein
MSEFERVRFRRLLLAAAIALAISATAIQLPTGDASVEGTSRRAEAEAATSGTGLDGLQGRLAPPSVPVVFVSRNRIATLNGIYVGPGLDIQGRELTPGGRLLVLHPDGRVVDLTSGSDIYDVQQPDVSFDGRTIVFSGVTSDRGQWHLFEIGIDGHGLRQLTYSDRNWEIPADPRSPSRNRSVFGRYGDFGPIYLPDGRIMFVSTRYATVSASCGHRGLNLYVLDPDTGDIHRRTTERSGAIDPYVMKNGMIVFSHWFDVMSIPSPYGPGLRPLEYDYNFAPSFWALWAVNPDGSNNGRYAFGLGGLVDSGGLYQPHEMPDGDLVATVRSSRSLLGSTLANAITRLTPGPTPRHSLKYLGDPRNAEAPHSLSPAPLPDGRIVCSYTLTPTLAVDWRGVHTADYDFGLVVVDGELENTTLLYNEPGTDELDAVAAYPRSAEIIPDLPDAHLVTDDPTVDLGTTAKLINLNVYADMPIEAVDLPSPKVGTVTHIEVYDDSQVFTTSEEFPKISKQMPRLVARFPVDRSGAFTATVPADRALLYILVNGNGVASRTTMSQTRVDKAGTTLTSLFGHDFLRPDGDFVCTGCHRGHMFEPDLAMASQANLARIAAASASSERSPFYAGAWRINDLRRADGATRYGWSSDGGTGEWVELRWPTTVEVNSVTLYPLTGRGCRVAAATLSFSDRTAVELGPQMVDGSPEEIAFGEPKHIRWLRYTVDDAATNLVGLGEIAVNGPADVILPDTPPPAPTNLTSTEGVIYLSWDPVRDPGVAGYRIHYGTEPGNYTEYADVGDVTTFVMRDLVEDGVAYYLAAKAYNVHGTESGEFSNEVSATAVAPVVTSITPTWGPTGGYTPITIKGRNFSTYGVRVTMGGSHALSVKVVDDETVTALTHWHSAGTVYVEVANPDDLKGRLEDAFTYGEPREPIIYIPHALAR